MAFIYMWNNIKDFYTSRKWHDCRVAFLKTRQGLCERCLKKGLIVPAEEVHHKIRLSKDNVNDPKISLNFDNLEALCIECHDKEHEADRVRRGRARRMPRRYAIDKRTGKVISRNEQESLPATP